MSLSAPAPTRLEMANREVISSSIIRWDGFPVCGAPFTHEGFAKQVFKRQVARLDDAMGIQRFQIVIILENSSSFKTSKNTIIIFSPRAKRGRGHRCFWKYPPSFSHTTSPCGSPCDGCQRLSTMAMTPCSCQWVSCDTLCAPTPTTSRRGIHIRLIVEGTKVNTHLLNERTLFEECVDVNLLEVLLNHLFALQHVKCLLGSITLSKAQDYRDQRFWKSLGHQCVVSCKCCFTNKTGVLYHHEKQ